MNVKFVIIHIQSTDISECRNWKMSGSSLFSDVQIVGARKAGRFLTTLVTDISNLLRDGCRGTEACNFRSYFKILFRVIVLLAIVTNLVPYSIPY